MCLTVRTFSMAGPCIREGTLLKRTPKFFVYKHRNGRNDYTKKIMCSKAHLTPCPSCVDHPQTFYPNGYMD